MEDICQEGVCGGTAATCACPECSPYLCFGASRTCTTTCSSVGDCAAGKVCDRSHQCVDPPDEPKLDDSGCVLTPSRAGSRSPWQPLALSLLTLCALVARRRSARLAVVIQRWLLSRSGPTK